MSYITLTACGLPTSFDAKVRGDFHSSGTPGGSIANYKLKCEEARFVKLLNLYRQSQGLNVVAVSRAGTEAARWMSNDMGAKAYFAHTEPSGRDAFQRMSDFGFGGQAENIAAGTYDAVSTFCLWRNSPGHNSNMLGYYQAIGVGQESVSGSPYGSYWTNDFGVASDLLSEPLTDDVNCTMPMSIPNC